MAGKREREILDAYEDWDSDELSVTALVEGLQISRQRLYNVLDRNQVVPKSKRAAVQSTTVQGDILTEMAEMALGYLLGQLQEARDELAAYRGQYGPLEV